MHNTDAKELIINHHEEQVWGNEVSRLICHYLFLIEKGKAAPKIISVNMSKQV